MGKNTPINRKKYSYKWEKNLSKSPKNRKNLKFVNIY